MNPFLTGSRPVNKIQHFYAARVGNIVVVVVVTVVVVVVMAVQFVDILGGFEGCATGRHLLWVHETGLHSGHPLIGCTRNLHPLYA